MLTGLVAGKAPSAVASYLNGSSFRVWYQDGTDVIYNIEGTGENITAVDCPGYLTYHHTENLRLIPKEPINYYYTYTEAGVTTGAFLLWSDFS